MTIDIHYRPIGVIHSPFRTPQDMPVQPSGAKAARGMVEVFAHYQAGLADLDGFSHIYLLYHFHRAKPFTPQVVPFLDSQPRGLFATRSPARPNPIGISIVRLMGRKGADLEVEHLDVLDGTPLLDLKPYVPAFDAYPAARAGWLETRAQHAARARADDRFTRGR